MQVYVVYSGKKKSTDFGKKKSKLRMPYYEYIAIQIILFENWFTILAVMSSHGTMTNAFDLNSFVFLEHSILICFKCDI